MSVITTASAEAFACYSKVCAPPPAGHGGSSKNAKRAMSVAELRLPFAERQRIHAQTRDAAKIEHARRQRRKARGERIEIGDARAIADDARARARTGSRIPDNPYRPKIQWAPKSRISYRESGEGDRYTYPTRGARGNAVARAKVYSQIRANALAEKKVVHWILDNHPEAQV